MGSFFIQRLSQTVFVVLAAALVSFAMFRYVGDPVNNMVGQAASLADREAMRRALGLDDPTILQFLRFLRDALAGDLGVSYRFGVPVSQLLTERFPATLELSLCAMLVATLLGIPLGVWTALHRRRVSSHVLMLLSLVGVALPTFLIGIVLILIFSVWLGWLPSTGRGEVGYFLGIPTSLVTWSGLSHLILPALNLALFNISLVIRLTRSGVRETMPLDFVKFARAKGVSERRIVSVHVLKNILIPIVTVVGVEFGSLIAFAIVTETIFAWPGMGKLLIDSIMRLDRPVVVAYLLVVVTLFIVINFVVDIIYSLLDPRIRLGSAS